jgi:membrane-bound lytic murein transglycosylase B
MNMAHRIKIMILPLLLIVSGNTGAVYAKPEFSVWLEENIWPKARASGVSRHVFKTATKGLKPDPKVLEAKDNQPEFVRPIWEYISRATSKKTPGNGPKKTERKPEAACPD